MGKEKKKQDRKRQERKKPSVFRQIKLGLQDPITLICMGIVFLILVACVVIYNTETKTDSGIETKFDTFWFMCVAVFANYFEY